MKNSKNAQEKYKEAIIKMVSKRYKNQLPKFEGIFDNLYGNVDKFLNNNFYIDACVLLEQDFESRIAMFINIYKKVSGLEDQL